MFCVQRVLLAQLDNDAERVVGEADPIGQEMLRQPSCAKIHLTGSLAVGKRLMDGASQTMKRLSLELGGPRQFGPHGPDLEFDAKAVEWIAGGDLEECLSEVTLDSLHAPGNATHGFMDFMLMMGVAGENAKADYVDTYDLFHTMEAYFTWYPNGAPE